jgi:hypothetical protein
MASVYDGALTPVEGSVGDLFGDKDVDGGSEVPSASLALTDTVVDGKKATTERTDVAKVDFQHAVGAAWDSLSSEHVEPIWNTGFWKCIFGDDSLGDALTQQFKRPMPTSDFSGGEPGDTDKRQKIDMPQMFSGPLFQTCVKSTDDISWQEKREALLQKSLKHWLVLTTAWRSDIEFVICLQGCDSSNSQLIMLGDVFRGKAPSTLNKRANSMKLLCNMLSKVGLDFPCSETSLYGVLCELRRQGAPPSRGKGILEAIAFVRYTMGIVECEPLLKGRRCWGATTSDEPVQRNQASPLRVQELEKLHYILEHDTDKWNKLFCGTVLFMVYARARWSDAQHATQILFDRAEGDIHFVEVLTGHHKTMRALQHRHQFLPLIAPATGVTGQNWAALWESVRDEMGISMDLGHALLPAPLDTGEPGKRALDSQEAGKWLRSLLELKLDAIENRKVSSHSLKCTMLSYLAKRGVEMSDRLLLGYHTSPFTMGLTYSRDGMARPLQILSDMLTEIRKGTFRPDCTRSGRLVVESNKKPGQIVPGSRDDTVKVESSDDEQALNAWDLIPMPQQCSLPLDIPVESENEVNDACTETSSSEQSDDGSSEPAFEKKGSRTFAPPVAPEGCTLWQHTKSKILHLTDYKTPHVFECGRRPGAFHTCQGVNPRWDTGICWKCFKNK